MSPEDPLWYLSEVHRAKDLHLGPLGQDNWGLSVEQANSLPAAPTYKAIQKSSIYLVLLVCGPELVPEGHTQPFTYQITNKVNIIVALSISHSPPQEDNCRMGMV